MLLLVLAMCFAVSDLFAADNYQLLRSSPAGYAPVVPGKNIQFPRDHLPHSAFKIEWWYLTANLTDDSGGEYGVHWTLFRQSMSPDEPGDSWSNNQIWMAHAAISTPEGHLYEERFARGGIGQAGVQVNPEGAFSGWLDNWSLVGHSSAPVPGVLTFTVQDKRIELNLNTVTPWVLQGENGFSQKSEKGQASYYYSQPHISVVGSLIDAGSEIKLDGKAWLDREWSSQPLASDQPGWDWLSVHLDDGQALMVYRLRQVNGKHWYSGTLVSANGVSESLSAVDMIFKPIQQASVKVGGSAARNLPLHWQLELPGRGKQWIIKAPRPDHWLNTTFPYWEGPVKVIDAESGLSVGDGYLELTGY